MSYGTVVLSRSSTPEHFSARPPARLLSAELDRRQFEVEVVRSKLANPTVNAVIKSKLGRHFAVVIDLGGELTELVAAGRVAAARSRLSQAGQRAAEAQWQAVLAPPTTSTKPKSGTADFARNAAWLREHSRAYVGKWVALANGGLVDHDTSRLALHRRLDSAGRLVSVTLIAKVG